MKIEIDVSFPAESDDLSKFKHLDRSFQVKHWPKQSAVSAELAEDISPTNIEAAIDHFLDVLDGCGGGKYLGNGLLRVAVYFSSDEAAAFSVGLSLRVLRSLSDHAMDLEVTGYPCSD